MKQTNLRRAVNLTALVLAAGLLIGLTGCFQLGSSKSLPLYSTDGNGVITGYNCGEEDLPKALVIPAKIGNEVITGIKDRAFYGCTGLTSIDLSACTSLTVIGVKEDTYSRKGAFEGCTGLTEVKLPASLTEIGDSAFYGCTGLTSIDLSGCTSLTEIGWYAFSGCTGLTSIDLSGCTSLTEIDGFSGCTGLTEVKLPASLTTIGGGAFAGCRGLTNVKLPASLIEIEWYAFKGCTGLTSAVFADKHNWKAGSTTIDPNDLADLSKAARYLRYTYADEYWKKN